MIYTIIFLYVAGYIHSYMELREGQNKIDEPTFPIWMALIVSIFWPLLVLVMFVQEIIRNGFRNL